ncbi:MAG: AraC family transcriptional regulator [Armatimonadetes bacterium]|nr:AraC family transcriptional regulator [Armatimonadota bacterium]MCX7966927.1 AraC family transcriptional regulator [Armatimonadota bacterium]MDW8144402.1 AraC family transcriptional regulator [Armatimonadota bacterium]
MLVRSRNQFTPFPSCDLLDRWAWVWDNAEIDFVGAWEHECLLGWHLSSRSLPHSLAVFVHEGRARWVIGDEKIVANAGALIFIPEGVNHSADLTSPHPFRATFVHLTARVFGVQCILALLGFPKKIEKAENFSEPVSELARLYALKPVGWKLRGQAIVTDLILRCVHEYPQLFQPSIAPKDAKALKWLCPAFQLLTSNESKITVSDLAKATMCSPTHLRRLFQKAVGMSPRQWLLERRLQRAAQLLQTTDKTIQQIADICGFESLSHFTRYFKAKFGMSPSQYRNIATQGIGIYET